MSGSTLAVIEQAETDPVRSDAPAQFLAQRRGPKITEPGVYTMSLEDYHRDPVPDGSLSSTGARRILPPGCPARFDYDRHHGRLATRAMELGTVAHSLLLGGPEPEVIDAPNRRGKDVKEFEAAARADGVIPMLAHEYEIVEQMVAAVRADPAAGPLFAPNSGLPEQSLFWQENGIWWRARPDWLRVLADGRLAVVDYKTCICADLNALSKTTHDLGYHQQGALYLKGVRALIRRISELLGVDVSTQPPAFLFAFQEKMPPYLVRIVELDVIALKIGDDLNEEAARVFRECSKSGRWPGYSDEVDLLPLPAWVENAYHWER